MVTATLSTDPHVSLGAYVAEGSHYTVYEHPSQRTHVLKIPKPRRLNGLAGLGPESTIAGALCVARCRWSQVVPTRVLLTGSTNEASSSHFIEQLRCDSVLGSLLRRLATARMWHLTMRLLDNLLSVETSAWRSGLFFQDTVSFLDNFALISGRIAAFDFSACTDADAAVDVWCRSPWASDRQDAMVERLGAAPRGLVTTLKRTLQHHYSPAFVWWHWCCDRRVPDGR